MAGATLGLVSILLPWIQYRISASEHLTYGYDYLSYVEAHAFVIFTTTMLAGSCLAYLTTIGGGVQLVGVVGFFAFANKDLHWTNWDFEIGFYLALLSAIIVCTSTLVPVGTGRSLGSKLRHPLKLNLEDSLTIVFSGNSTRIDGLGVLGAFIGIYAVGVAAWTYQRPTPRYGIYDSVYQMDVGSNLFHYAISQTMGLGPTIIIAGTLLMFISSIAVVMLLGGEVLFIQAAMRASDAGEIESVGGGALFVLMAVVMAGLSIASVLSQGKSRHSRPTWRDFLTVGVSHSAKV